MSVPVYVSAGAYLSGSGASAQVEVPPGAEPGMLVIVVMFLDGAALDEPPTVPEGFEAAPGSPVQITGVGGQHSLYVWHKRLTGFDTGTYAFAWTGSRFREAQATLWQGVVASGDPWDVDVASATDLANDTVTPPVAIATTGPDRLLIWAATCWAGGTWTAPAGFTKRVQGGVGLVTLADRPWPIAGPTGDVVGQVTGADKRTVWLGALVGGTDEVLVDLDDVAAADEAVAVTAYGTAGEAGSAAEMLAAEVAADVADGAVGADVLAAAAVVLLADEAASAEAAQVAVAVPLAEAGVALDALRVAGPRPQRGVMADRVRRGPQASHRDRPGPHMASRVRAGSTMGSP
nr:MAG: hypothetical protein DIU60_23200 [Actinomycetota bacterium]